MSELATTLAQLELLAVANWCLWRSPIDIDLTKLATVQACVIHLLRNTFRYGSRKDWHALSKDLRPPYTAPTESSAVARFDEPAERWALRYPAVIKLWRSAWTEFTPFLDYDVEIRRFICTTNAIESINARYRRAIRAKGHFPTEQAALKCLHLVTRSLDRTTREGARWVAGRPRSRLRGHFRRPYRPEHDQLMPRSVTPSDTPRRGCQAGRAGLRRDGETFRAATQRSWVGGSDPCCSLIIS